MRALGEVLNQCEERHGHSSAIKRKACEAIVHYKCPDYFRPQPPGLSWHRQAQVCVPVIEEEALIDFAASLSSRLVNRFLIDWRRFLLPAYLFLCRLGSPGSRVGGVPWLKAIRGCHGIEMSWSGWLLKRNLNLPLFVGGHRCWDGFYRGGLGITAG